jgi:hypothetical protein
MDKKKFLSTKKLFRLLDSDRASAIRVKGTEINFLVHSIYILLLSSTVVNGENIYSDYTRENLLDFFGSQFGDEQVIQAIEVLEEKQFISQEQGGDFDIFLLGYVDGRSYYLLEETEDSFSFEEIFKPVYALIDSWHDAASTKGRKSVIKGYSDFLDKLCTKDDITIPDYVEFFGVVYAAQNQVEHREFMQKEYGQIKTIYNLYEYDVAFQIITEYILNTEAYHKHPPTIASLLHYKDEIYSKLYKVSRKEQLRTKENTNDDF